MATNFSPLVFDSINVGRHIKGSKKRYIWKFELDGKENIVDLYISKFTGKRKILINGDIKIDARKLGAYATYPLKIGKHSIIVYEKEANVYDLRCDNLSFDETMRKIKYKSTRDNDFSNSDLFDKYDALSIKNMAYLYDEEHSNRHEKNKWKTNLSGIKKSKKQPSNEFQTSTNPSKIIDHSSHKTLEQPKENEPLDIMNTPSTTISFMPSDLFTNPTSEMQLGTFSMSSNPFESNSIYPRIQESQSFTESQKYNSTSEHSIFEKSQNFPYEEAHTHKTSKNPFDFPQDYSSYQNQLSQYQYSSEIAYPYVTSRPWINPH
ncbi:unnamed protein product [Blepharisma stoltei]|uniref:Uncharacterized protein n=1 Tax=Blepharisma stoltei TaxID=1481888 RepID=A0AAU9JDZ2_9CILI|nr:unnamed protein product [Blepharisma stoltei]